MDIFSLIHTKAGPGPILINMLSLESIRTWQPEDRFSIWDIDEANRIGWQKYDICKIQYWKGYVEVVNLSGSHRRISGAVCVAMSIGINFDETFPYNLVLTNIK